MFVQDNLENIKTVSPDCSPHPHFLTIFIVIAPFIVFAISGLSSNAPEQLGLAWLFLAIALSLTIRTAIRLSMFRRKAIALPIRPQVRRALAAPTRSIWYGMDPLNGGN